MKIIVTYSKIEFEATVDFISRNNKHFWGQKTFIENSILESIDSLCREFPNIVDYNTGTMGFYVNVINIEVEDIDHERNRILISFTVDPALCNETKFQDEDFVEYTFLEAN